MTSDLVSSRESGSTPARGLSPGQAAAAVMVAEARTWGLGLTGPDGLLTLFTENVVEPALNEEMAEHLGPEKNQAGAGRESTNVRNGSRAKTVISDSAGEVEIAVARDREGTVELQNKAAAWARRSAKGTMSWITDKVVNEMPGWANRPLGHACGWSGMVAGQNS
jgi:putative transposase